MDRMTQTPSPVTEGPDKGTGTLAGLSEHVIQLTGRYANRYRRWTGHTHACHR